MDNQPKISTLEAFLLIAGALILEIIPIILVLLGLPDFFIPGIIGFTSQLYFRMKGVPSRFDLIASIGELIPYVDVLPMKTFGIAMTIWIDRHPQSKLAQLAQKTAKPAAIKPGKVSAPGIKTPIGGLAQVKK